MKPWEVKIGESYRLIPQKEAEELDERYRDFGHDVPTVAVFTDYDNIRPTEKVKIVEVQWDDPARFRATFPSGKDWWVSAEWLIPNEPKQPKSTVRRIGR